MRRLALPLAVALLLVAAVPAAAGKPTPSVETSSIVPLSSSCLAVVEVTVPKAGRRVGSVELGSDTWTDGKWLNGQSNTLTTWAPSGESEVTVHVYDHRGNHLLDIPVTVICDEVDTRPPPA